MEAPVEAPVEESTTVKTLMSDAHVTKQFNVSMMVGKGSRKKIPWMVQSKGTFSVVSSCPELVVPMTDVIEVKLGEDQNRVIRLNFLATSTAMKTEAKIVVRRDEDDLVVECFLFQINVIAE
jgi:hypothetical protein